MRIFLKMHASKFCMAGIVLSILAIFLCFLPLGATSLFGYDATLFELIFGMNQKPLIVGLVFAFLFLLVSVVLDFVSFLFSRQGRKSDIRFSALFSVLGVIFGFLSSLLFVFSPFYTEIYSLNCGPFVVFGVLLFSQIFQLPNILFQKL